MKNRSNVLFNRKIWYKLSTFLKIFFQFTEIFTSFMLCCINNNLIHHRIVSTKSPILRIKFNYAYYFYTKTLSTLLKNILAKHSRRPMEYLFKMKQTEVWKTFTERHSRTDAECHFCLVFYCFCECSISTCGAAAPKRQKLCHPSKIKLSYQCFIASAQI